MNILRHAVIWSLVAAAVAIVVGAVVYQLAPRAGDLPGLVRRSAGQPRADGRRLHGRRPRRRAHAPRARAWDRGAAPAIAADVPDWLARRLMPLRTDQESML